MANQIVHKYIRKKDASTMCGKPKKDKDSSRWEHVTCKTCLAIKARRKKQGRETLWRPEFIETIFLLKSKFFTDAEIAIALGVARTTFIHWKNTKPEVVKVLEEAKQEAIHKTERSLFERANGCSHTETRVFTYQGQIVEHDVVKHYAPDTQAMQFLLNNLAPDKWRKDPTNNDEISKDGKVTINIGSVDE